VGAYFAGVDALSRLELTESSHKAVIYHTHQLRKLDAGAACQLLRPYLVQQLALHGNEQWIEATLTTLVWMSTSLEYSIETAATLEATFTQLHEKWTKPLSAEATHIVLVLLWKQIELGSNYEKFGDAAVWCQLAMHPLLFDNLDDLNAGKIQRYATLRAASAAHDSADKLQEVSAMFAEAFEVRGSPQGRAGNVDSGETSPFESVLDVLHRNSSQ
jgi:hypothetical protein